MGGSGFTDGRQLLGTPPDKDLAYPCNSSCWGPKSRLINKEMSDFSFHAYLIDQGELSGWVDRGKPPPQHRKFGLYQKWVAAQLRLKPIISEISAIDIVNDHFRLRGKSSAQGIEGDGLMITGPGEPSPLRGQPAYHRHILNGKDFWRNLRKLGRKREVNVGIIGTGETAASIACALLPVLGGTDSFVEIIAPKGALYSRDEGFLANQKFSEPKDWEQLSLNHRAEFIDRTDLGVFSSLAMSVMGKFENWTLIGGRVVNMKTHPRGVRLRIDYDGRKEDHSYDYVIVASGFDPLWFTKLMTPRAKEALREHLGGLKLSNFVQQIDSDLSVKGFRPLLHLPMLSRLSQGPGFPNLSCLGHLSDRILSRYVRMPLIPDLPSIKGGNTRVILHVRDAEKQ